MFLLRSSFSKRDNGNDHRAGTIDLQAEKATRKSGFACITLLFAGQRFRFRESDSVCPVWVKCNFVYWYNLIIATPFIFRRDVHHGNAVPTRYSTPSGNPHVPAMLLREVRSTYHASDTAIRHISNNMLVRLNLGTNCPLV